jgi:hypothetical protein
MGFYTFYSQAPFAYGEGKAVKFIIRPTDAAADSIGKYPLEEGNFNLKNFCKSIVKKNKHLQYKQYVQFQEDPCTEPIKDGSAYWILRNTMLEPSPAPMW